MKGYIFSIVGVVLLTALVAIVAPSGKLGGFIKGLVKLAGVFVLVSPFVALFSGESFAFETGTYAYDEEYLATSGALMEQEDEGAIAAYLTKEYAVTAEVRVKRTIPSFSLKSIQVNIVDFGINGENEHINIVSRIQSDLKGRYGCEAEVTCNTGNE